MKIISAVLSAVLVASSMPAWAQCAAKSPAYSVALIELFTSEGCDSCPPADRWLSTLDQHGLAPNAVALALHVDYWDRLGWRDRFASAKFTQRQQQEAMMQQSGLVYTPQVVIQGRDFRDWSTLTDSKTAFAAINARPARARIELSALPAKSNAKVDIGVEVADPKDRADAKVTVALVQSGLTSEVKAGENAGKRLQHDRVVRQWRSGIEVDASGHATDHLVFQLPSDMGPMALVAFVENARTGDVLQALELPLCTAN